MKEAKVTAVASAVAAAAVNAPAETACIPSPAPPPDEEMDLALRVTETEAAAAAIQAQRRSIYATQADSIRKRAGLSAEMSRLKNVGDASVNAQGAAAAQEDYERAAQLSEEISQIRSQEAACASAMGEAILAYEHAEAEKARMDREELALYQSHAEDCRRCLAAREERSRREAATATSRLELEERTLAAEAARLGAEESTIAAKEHELNLKLDEANMAITQETTDVEAEKARVRTRHLDASHVNSYCVICCTPYGIRHRKGQPWGYLDHECLLDSRTL